MRWNGTGLILIPKWCTLLKTVQVKIWHSKYKGQRILPVVQLLRMTEHTFHSCLRKQGELFQDSRRKMCIQRPTVFPGWWKGIEGDCFCKEWPLRVNTCSLLWVKNILIWPRSCRTAHFFRVGGNCYISHNLNLFNLLPSMFLSPYFLLKYTYLKRFLEDWYALVFFTERWSSLEKSPCMSLKKIPTLPALEIPGLR